MNIIKGITSKHHSDFYFLNCHSFATENKRESHEKVFENQYQKSDKTPFAIYADLECLTEKIDNVKIILNILSQQKQVRILH